jgi:hypothetical protein
MKNPQQGFGAHGVIGVIAVIGIIGLSGWFVWHKSTNNDSSASTQTTTTAPAPSKATAPEKYIVPDGFTLYEKPDYGFKFAYPTEWGELNKIRNEAEPTLIAETAEKSFTNGYVGGKLSIRVDKATSFSQMAAYHGYDVKPERAGSEYNWIVSSVAPGIENGIKVGDTFDPQPELVYKNGGLRVYQFNLSHACGEWSALAFPVSYNFVSITVPSFCSMNVEAATEADADKALADYKATIVKVAKTIRQGN